MRPSVVRRSVVRRFVVTALLSAVLLPVPGSAGPLEPCTDIPDPTRWSDAGDPDEGAELARLAVHRGAAELAPENTLDAYRYAIAYLRSDRPEAPTDRPDLIEIDVQQTVDHQFVVFHDLDVAGKTDGEGYIFTMTAADALELNVADNDKWRDSIYNPSRMPTLDEVLQLAADAGVGIYFDLKESVTDPASVALRAKDFGLIEDSIFVPFVPYRAEAILAAVPEANLMHSNQIDDDAAGFYYAASVEFDWFGSSLPGYDAEKVAEIHDACSQVMPNVYQGHVTGSEAGDLAHARSIGVDGAQVNNPDVAVEVLGRPVDAVITSSDVQACLVDAVHGFGFPGKAVEVDGAPAETGRDGCVPTDPNATVTFAGDGSVNPAG